jgi:hypothetical protein
MHFPRLINTKIDSQRALLVCQYVSFVTISPEMVIRVLGAASPLPLKLATPNKNNMQRSVESARTKLQKRNRTAKKSESAISSVNISDEKLLRSLQGRFGEYICNMLEPSCPFQLPRLVPVENSPDFQDPEMTINQTLTDNPYGALIIRPDVHRTVTHVTGGEFEDYVGSSFVAASDNIFIPAGANMYIASPIFLQPDTDGPYVGVKGVLQASTSTVGSGFHLAPDGSTRNLSAGYLAQFVTPNDIGFTVAVYNSSFSTINVDLTLLNWSVENGPGTPVSTISAGPVQPFSSVNVAWAVGSASLSGPGFAIAVNFANSTGFFLPSGFSVTVTPTVDTVTLLPTLALSYLEQWRTYSLFDLMGNVEGVSDLKSLYESASALSVTGLSALLQNTTSNFYKSGSLVACQMVGGTEGGLPGNLVQLYGAISAQNTVRSYSGGLADGCHWSYVPEKIQDWFFRPPVPVQNPMSQQSDRPYVVMVWSAPFISDSSQALGLRLKIRMNVERLTSNVAAVRIVPVADIYHLMELYLTLCSAWNNLGENPNHIAKVKSLARKVVTHPAFKQLVKAGGNAMIGNIPQALAHLGGAFLDLKPT